MRASGRAAADLLAFAGTLVVPGATGEDIDRVFHEEAVRRGVYPSPLNYAGFPKSLCVSINEVVCHGIPDSTTLEAGDVVKLDVSVFVGGRHGDTCRTFVAGGLEAADPSARRLVLATKSALDRAVLACGPGMRVSAIGDCVHALLDAGGFGVVREYAGHGIGQDFHTQPIVFHHRNRSQAVLRPGMTFTIEPIVVEGRPDIVMWPDGWAIVTADRSWGAQFEHTLLVTDHGVDVLTAYE